MGKRRDESLILKNPLAIPPKKREKVKRVELPSSEVEDVKEKAVEEEPQFDLYVGTEHGVLKGISFGKELPIAKNVFRPEDLVRDAPGVVSLAWANPEEGERSEKELLVTLSNHVVKTYNTKLRCFTRQVQLEVEPEETKLTGLYHHDNKHYIFGLEDGSLAMWDYLESNLSLKIKTGNNMRKVRQCLQNTNLYATGGNENDLKVWDLSSEKPEVPKFKARNVPHDNLDLRIPVWVEDLTFLPRTEEEVCVGTRYGQIRLYDIRETNSRPVSNIQAFDHPIMSISATMDNKQVVVGTAQGEVGWFDLRNAKHEKLLRKFGGINGSIRSLVACHSKPYFVSASIDRHFYVHNFNQKKPIKKIYMKQQMNCIAVSESLMSSLEAGAGVTVEGDYANIPPEVLNIGPPIQAPSSPKKRKK